MQEGGIPIRKHDRQWYIGLFWGLMAGIAWGTVGVGMRYLAHDRGLFPPVLVFWRLLMAAGVLMALGRPWRGNMPRPGARELIRFLWFAFFGIFVGMNCAFGASRFTTNINVTIIIAASAVFMALISRVLGQRVSRRQWAGIWVGLAGVVLIALAMEEGDGAVSLGAHALGILLAGATSILWALYTVLSRDAVEKYGGLTVAAWALAVAALMQAPILLLPIGMEATRMLTGMDWAILAYLAVVPTSLSFAAWLKALESIDATTLGMTQYPGPLVSALLGWLLLSEKILPQHVLGGALILVGLHFASRPPAPEADRAGN